MTELLCTLVIASLPAAAPPQAALSFDRYGGWKAVRFEPGRFFRTHFDGQRWWLVTPEGHGFISIGACVVGPQGSAIRGTGRLPYHEGVLAKHGNEATWAKVTRARLEAWGFNTMACWSGSDIPDMPRADILNVLGGKTAWMEGGMPDFFDPRFSEHVAKAAEQCRRQRENPWLIGWFLDNELAWDKDWRRAPNLFDRYMKLDEAVPGKQALCAVMRERYATPEAFNKTWSPSLTTWGELGRIKALTPNPGQESAARADREVFVLHAARRYFRIATEAIRANDTNHLILGCRFVSWVAPRMVVKACGEFCDVVSINFYEMGIVGHIIYSRWRPSSDWIENQPDLTGFYQLAKKPLMITEFGFRSKDSGLPNTYPPPFAVQPLVEDQEQRAERYERYVRGWMREPFFVGYHWFRYMDEPKEGRFDGENGNYGLVDLRDEAYETFVNAITKVNRGVWSLHRQSAMSAALKR